MDNPGPGKLNDVADWVRERMAEKGDLTLDALVVELREYKGVTVHRSGVGKLLHRLGLSHKKDASGERASPPRRREEAPRLADAPPSIHEQPSGTAGLSGW